MCLFSRLLYIHIIRRPFLTDLAKRQHNIFVKLEPRRGNIYDRAKRVLAVYLDVASVYAVPREIGNAGKAADIISKNLDLDRGAIESKLGRDNYFVWIKRKVEPGEAEIVRNLDVKGVYLTDEAKRFYPGKTLACHVLGITDIDNDGLEGVELQYNKELKGEYGWKRSMRDAKRRELVSFQSDILPKRDGENLVLTIDEVIQYIVEKEVQDIVGSYRPTSVSIVALDPRTGEVLALANYPAFDPNNVNDTSALKNRAISDSFEPGSVFKIVTASAALEEGVVDFDTEVFCEEGTYKVGRRILHDYRPYGNLSFRQVIEKSSNIGTVKVAAKLGKEKMAMYIKRFNLDRPTGIDLPGEVSGIMRDPDKWRDVDMTTIPMGQGIAITALQLATTVSVIANDGVLMRPYLVSQTLNENGALIRERGAQKIRRVISKETAAKVKELMEGVVERGSGKKARLSDFRAGGKTGTAQKVDPKGGYYKKKYIASFIGFAPYETPLVALVICVDDPRKKHFGGQVCAPAFKNIMEKILSYLEIESDRKSEAKKTS
ncbi:MAG: penicillin-binding transpeptidase domain-containing protein [Candidatus Omnitrophota bacterium]